MIAVVPCAPFQARTIPSSPSNRNKALPPVGRMKPVVVLKTVPVGPPGTETISPCFTPAALYRVDLLVPLSETHHGVVGPEVRPHAFLRSGSVSGASKGWFETSGTTVYVVGFAAPSGAASTNAAPSTSSPRTALVRVVRRAIPIPAPFTRTPQMAYRASGGSVFGGEPEAGFEPTTYRLQIGCSDQLSYSGACRIVGDRLFSVL